NIFHPYYQGREYIPSDFSVDITLTEPKSFSPKNAFLVIKIRSSNDKDYELLDRVYKVKKKYKDYVEKILYKEILSIEVVL
ncbi:hypothetical protein ACXOQJ_09765, partial [Streptococcus thermophilus]